MGVAYMPVMAECVTVKQSLSKIPLQFCQLEDYLPWKFSALKENVVHVGNVVQENFCIKKCVANVRNGIMSWQNIWNSALKGMIPEKERATL